MKTIGLIGGMSWESSIEYYRIINERVKEKLGGLHSANCLMYSFDFDKIEKLQHQNQWQALTREMIDIAGKLERSGAGLVVICSNTMHKMADDIQQKLNIPLLHIADATADRIKAKSLKKIGVIGTSFTMEETFYKGRLIEKHGLDVIVPDKKSRKIIHDIIYQELCLGIINPASKNKYVEIINNLAAGGADAVILGCTEISLLVQQADVKTTLLDTTKIHAESAVDYALSSP